MISIAKMIFSFYEAVNDGEIVIFPLQGYFNKAIKRL